MAILSCTEEWRGLTGQDNLGTATYNRLFKVVFDNQDEPCLRPLLAHDNTTVGPNPIPQMWTSHPFNPWLVVVDIQPRAIGPMLFDVEVTYSNKPQYTTYEGANIFINPCEQPWDIEWDSVEYNDRVDFDIYGNHIANTIGDPPDPNVTDDYIYPSVTIVRNLAEWNHALMGGFVNKVNSDTFWGYAAGTALCKTNRARRMRQGNVFFWQATTVILFNPFVVINGKNVGGWNRRIRNEGYDVNVNIGGIIKPARAQVEPENDGVKKDDPTALPVFINADGYRIPKGGDAYWLSFKTKYDIAFSGLNLGNY